MKKLVCFVFLTALAIVPASSPAAQGSAQPAEAAKPCAQAASEGMFVQTAPAGRYENGRLYLDHMVPRTLFFTDRPQRKTGQVPAAAFLDLWNRGPDSFETDPPNASLAFLDGAGQRNAVVILTDPRIDGTTLSYQVKLLEGELPAAFGDASLFIDPGGGGMMQCCAYGPCCNN